MKIKKKYFASIRSFSGLAAHFNANDYLWKKLSENFEKIYIINNDNLKFFPNLRQRWIKKDYDFQEISKHSPKNIILFNPKNSREFSDFISDKELIIINQFRRLIQDLKTHLLVKKHKIKQVQITNLGYGFGASQHVSLNHPLKLINHYGQLIFKRFITILAILGVISKVEIRFISTKIILDNIKKNFLKNLLYKNKLNFAKELILVNSRTYDILLDENILQSEKYIVHLNADLNYWHEVVLRGEMPTEIVNLHYKSLERFLKKLSAMYNKKVLVCIHPAYDLESTKKFFKDFDVIKYRTRKCIYNAFLVTNFDSSAVVDAVLLKKNIIGLISNYMSKNEIEHSKGQAARCGYLTLNIEKDYNFDHNLLLKNMEKKIENYENNIINYHCFEPNVNGTDKIIKIIKERFF